MLTKRQEAYRVYLLSDHWQALREAALGRDGYKCVVCDSADRLQVHHLKYRGHLEDGILEDVETLCRKCHRLAHGIGPNDLEMKYREIERHFGCLRRPPVALWREFREMMLGDGNEFELELFGELMFRFVMNVVSHEREGSVANWWMDKEKNYFWFRKAHNIRKAIKERSNHVRKALCINV